MEFSPALHPIARQLVMDAKVFAVFVATPLIDDPMDCEPKVVRHWWCHIAKQQLSPHKAMFHIMDGPCLDFDAEGVVAPGQELTLRAQAEFQNDVQAMSRVDRSFKWQVSYFMLKPDMRPVVSVTPNCVTVVPMDGVLLRTIWPPRKGDGSKRASWGNGHDEGSEPSEEDEPGPVPAAAPESDHEPESDHDHGGAPPLAESTSSSPTSDDGDPEELALGGGGEPPPPPPAPPPPPSPPPLQDPPQDGPPQDDQHGGGGGGPGDPD
eukprot:4296750-Pyramimonas_sp.AAC.1